MNTDAKFIQIVLAECEHHITTLALDENGQVWAHTGLYTVGRWVKVCMTRDYAPDQNVKGI